MGAEGRGDGKAKPVFEGWYAFILVGARAGSIGDRNQANPHFIGITAFGMFCMLHGSILAIIEGCLHIPLVNSKSLSNLCSPRPVS